MAARILHFGTDDCCRLPVLTGSGFMVDSCGTSVPKFHQLLQQAPPDAIAVTEAGIRFARRIVTLTRSATPAPIILFQGSICDERLDLFDLVIPAGTHPPKWLEAISQTIARTRALCDDAALLRGQSAALRQESATVRERSEATRRRVGLLKGNHQDR